ncbi:MAG: glutathione S-transferase N-terminal domain-containing protein [Lautropia sp.]
MKLYMSAGSPFARKALVCALERGLGDRIERERVALSPVTAHGELATQNPLMKVPVLVTDDGRAIYDSPVICEYLDAQGDAPRLIPSDPAERWQVLTLQALADGLLDAAIACRFENGLRPAELRWAAWTEGQSRKALQSLDRLQQEPLVYADTLHLGQIAVACALSWLEFRKPIGEVRAGRERLFDWSDAFARRSSMVATRPE